MTHPAHHPKCECDFCFTDDLNAVLRRFLEQREKGKPPVDPDAEQLYGTNPMLAALPELRADNERMRLENIERERQFTDPDAEQLAGEVGELAGEMRRGAA